MGENEITARKYLDECTSRICSGLPWSGASAIAARKAAISQRNHGASRGPKLRWRSDVNPGASLWDAPLVFTKRDLMPAERKNRQPVNGKARRRGALPATFEPGLVAVQGEG